MCKLVDCPRFKQKGIPAINVNKTPAPSVFNNNDICIFQLRKRSIANGV